MSRLLIVPGVSGPPGGRKANRVGFAFVAVAACAAASAQAQEPAKVEGLPGVSLRLVPPQGLCRLDPVQDQEAFETMARPMSSKVLAIWLACPDLAHHRAGEDVAPARWMFVLAQRDGRGQVRPLQGISRQEAFVRWADAWTKEADQRLAQAKVKMKAELNLEAAELSKPQIISPDGTAIYLALLSRLTDAGATEPTRVATVSGWSMIENYRVGISLAQRDAGVEAFDGLQVEVRDAMVSLDRLSAPAGVH